MPYPNPTPHAQAANRVNFNQPEEEFIDGDDVIGLGVLGKEGSGRLRMQAQAQRQKLSAKAAKKFAKRAPGGAGGAVNGLSSSLAFTPIQARARPRRDGGRVPRGAPGLRLRCSSCGDRSCCLFHGCGSLCAEAMSSRACHAMSACHK